MNLITFESYRDSEKLKKLDDITGILGDGEQRLSKKFKFWKEKDFQYFQVKNENDFPWRIKTKGKTLQLYHGFSERCTRCGYDESVTA